MRGAVVLFLAVASGCVSEERFDYDAGDLVRAGGTFVEARGCPTCHDSTAGRLAGATKPVLGTTAYPANLTPDHATGIGDWADIEIMRAIRFGFDDQGEPLCPTMPNFTDMTDLEAHAIVSYLRSLPPVSHAVAASRCPPLKPPPPVDMAMTIVPTHPLDLGAAGD